jgi:hypothetical protein
VQHAANGAFGLGVNINFGACLWYWELICHISLSIAAILGASIPLFCLCYKYIKKDAFVVSFYTV